MLPPNRKRTTSSKAQPIFYAAKNSAIKIWKVPPHCLFNLAKIKAKCENAVVMHSTWEFEADAEENLEHFFEKQKRIFNFTFCINKRLSKQYSENVIHKENVFT